MGFWSHGNSNWRAPLLCQMASCGNRVPPNGCADLVSNGSSFVDEDSVGWRRLGVTGNFMSIVCVVVVVVVIGTMGK